ncbi:MAG: hypothetical protein CFE24_04120 [Flavobacterium sp. BFFFF2]|nr:MAG: hypothetical protein CFE24_04120 [Flavobacterium sp. BFFFF2]
MCKRIWQTTVKPRATALNPAVFWRSATLLKAVVEPVKGAALTQENYIDMGGFFYIWGRFIH